MFSAYDRIREEKCDLALGTRKETSSDRGSINLFGRQRHERGSRMDWMRRQDIKEESPETPTALTPDEPDECYFEEDTSIDEGMVRDSRGYCHSFIQTRASFESPSSIYL